MESIWWCIYNVWHIRSIVFQKQTTQSKKWGKGLSRHFSKEDIQMANKTWKDAHRPSLLEKCKSKLQWAITSHQSEWPLLKSLQTINAGDGVEKKEPSCTAGGNVNGCSCYGRWYGNSFKKLGIKQLYDPAIPLLGTHPEETKIEKDTCIPLLIAVLFTIARTWKRPRSPMTNEWIKKLWYVYTVEYSAIRRNTFASVLMG